MAVEPNRLLRTSHVSLFNSLQFLPITEWNGWRIDGGFGGLPNYGTTEGEDSCGRRDHVTGDVLEDVFLPGFPPGLAGEVLVLSTERPRFCKHFTGRQRIGGGLYHLLDLPTSPGPMAY